MNASLRHVNGSHCWTTFLESDTSPAKSSPWHRKASIPSSSFSCPPHVSSGLHVRAQSGPRCSSHARTAPSNVATQPCSSPFHSVPSPQYLARSSCLLSCSGWLLHPLSMYHCQPSLVCSISHTDRHSCAEQ